MKPTVQLSALAMTNTFTTSDRWNRRARVTAARADALDRVTGAVADFWQGLQHDYDRTRTKATKTKPPSP